MDGLLQSLLLGQKTSFIEGASLDLQFTIGRYWLNGETLSQSELSQYFSRSSSAYGQRLNGDYIAFASNQPRILSGVGYQSEEPGTNLVTNGFDWSASGGGGAVVGDLYEGDISGINTTAYRIASDGLDWHRSNKSCSALTASTEYMVQAAFVLGTSGLWRVEIRDGALGISYLVAGSIDGVTTQSTQVSDLALAVNPSGLIEVSFKFTTPTSVGGSWLAGIGPHSDIVGEDIIPVYIDIKSGSSLTSFTDGARSGDSFIIPSSVLNFDLGTGFAFIKYRQMDRSSLSFPSLMELYVDNNNRISYNNDTSDPFVWAQYYSMGVNEAQFQSPINESGVTILGSTWDGNNIISNMNGVVVTDTTISAPLSGAAQLQVGVSGGGSQSNFIVERVVMGQGKLTESELDNIYSQIAA